MIEIRFIRSRWAGDDEHFFAKWYSVGGGTSLYVRFGKSIVDLRDNFFIPQIRGLLPKEDIISLLNQAVDRQCVVENGRIVSIKND